MSTLDEFVDEMRSKGSISEDTFKFILQNQDLVGEIDSTKEKVTGKPLNDLNTNRQRASIITHPKFIEERSNKRKHNNDANNNEKENDQPTNKKKNKKKVIICCMSDCMKQQSESPTIKWKQCPTKGCNRYFCNKQACENALTTHITICKPSE